MLLWPLHEYNPYGCFPKLGALFGGPQNKDYSILGSILGFPYLGKIPHRLEFWVQGLGLAHISKRATGKIEKLSHEPRTPSSITS